LLLGLQPSEIRGHSPEHSQAHQLDNKIQTLGKLATSHEETSYSYINFPSSSFNIYALGVDMGNYAPRMLYGETLILDPNLDSMSGDEVFISQKILRRFARW